MGRRTSRIPTEGLFSRFTGERLHGGSELFRVDLARHQAAYRFACELIGAGLVLDLGSGSGHGTAELAAAGARVVGLDRVSPDPEHRQGTVAFVRGDLEALPFAAPSFDGVVSFQVIEHLDKPDRYLGAMARVLRRGGTALLSTPNRRRSLGVNPYHLHEYEREELRATLGRHFERIEILGVGATEPVNRYLEARARRIRGIVRLDPLQLRERLPRRLVEWLFSRLAILVRRSIRHHEGLPDVTWLDFPVGAAEDGCLDLLAVCRQPT